MINFKKFLAIIMAITSISVLFLSTNTNINKVYAEETGETTQEENWDRGWFVTLSINIGGGNGQVWATAKHDFSIFSSTVNIYVYLYYSTTLTTDYNNMTLAASAHISDLDLGQILTATAYTGGEQRYWIGRMYYKIDNNNWEERISGPVLCSASGALIST